MNRILVIILALLGWLPTRAQIHLTQNGSVSFTSDAPLELIQAKSEELQGAINPNSYTFAFSLRIQSLNGFNSELQKQHFNEKFLESRQYPKATFSGKLIERIDFSQNGTYDVRAKGSFHVHGVSQERIIRAQLIIEDGVWIVRSRFKVLVADHNITVPKVVYQNIAEEIEVEIQARLIPDNK
ncbi:MAG: YceI family protein [Bacteroidota bacterium]